MLSSLSCSCLTPEWIPESPPTLSLQTMWTSFDPPVGDRIILSRPRSGGNNTCKVFYIQQGHCDRHKDCHTPGARMVCSAFHSIKVVVSQVGALWMGLQARGGLTVKAHCLRAPTHPFFRRWFENSLSHHCPSHWHILFYLLRNGLQRFWLHHYDCCHALIQTYYFDAELTLMVELWVHLSSHWPLLLEHLLWIFWQYSSQEWPIKILTTLPWLPLCTDAYRKLENICVENIS